MQSARPAPDSPALQMLVGWLQPARQLQGTLGVTLRFAPVPARDVGKYDAPSRTLTIREDADIDDQVWLMQEVLRYLQFGPHASPTAQPLPLLHVVPSSSGEGCPEGQSA